MAEPLKNHYGAEIPRTIATMVSTAFTRFDREAFLRDALDGYEALELMDRGRKIAAALYRYLPQDYSEALSILVASTRVDIERPDHSMASFLYMPHLHFVGAHGLDHFEESMDAQYELTQKFTAEFSIRPFLIRHQAATLERLQTWARDGNVHVRRLVSEGTRPRLPWAPRLPAFQKDPAPVLALLELLKDDPELYVRRSVANNLNDIGKDHPDLLVETARLWMEGATDDRRRLVRHALRSAVKLGDARALGVLGFAAEAKVTVRNARLDPIRVESGSSVKVAFDLVSTGSRPQRVLADLRVYFVKANGSTNAKVFKLTQVNLGPQETVALKKSISLKEMTTRKHYPGKHRVELLLNGRAHPVGAFDVVKRHSP